MSTPKPSARRVSLMIIWASILFSLAFFLASLRMTALVVQNEQPVSGLQTLLLGWMGFLAFQFPWLANPAYLIALVLTACHKFGSAQVCLLVALGFGLLSNFTFEWYGSGRVASPVLRLGPAFYCWLGSFCMLFVGATISRMID